MKSVSRRRWIWKRKREIDTNFLVGLFDFPMIDNTRLSGQRALLPCR